MADTPINALTNQEVVKQGNNELRRTVQHLPAFYRTDTNERFLSSTLDPLIQKGKLERLDGYIGRQDAYTRQVTDRYLTATNRDRFAYQLEPAVTYTDRDTTSINPEDQVKFTGTYDDYINQLKYFGGKVDNHDRLNNETLYSWNPAIDYDKLINYREYYWMPTGPNAIEIDSVGPNVVAEYNVEAHKEDGSSVKAWNFLHRENERNPIIKLYRGNTYKFNVDAEGHPFYIMTEPYKSLVSSDGSTSTIHSTGVTNNGAEIGTVTFTVPLTGGPDTLYYQCGAHDVMYGILQLKAIATTDQINVANDIVGVKNYSIRTLDISNGMKIKFKNSLVGIDYQNKEYYIEGVGDAITLTDVENLIAPASYSTEATILYDSAGYDSRPYAKAYYRPDNPDYISIKRDSLDQNAWSRYNRWFHRSVIEETARVNGFTPVLDETDRAKRPIIEFDSGLALYNHGKVAKKSVTLYDTITTDAFSSVAKQTSYIIDGIALADGMRVIFSTDTDLLVKNKIYDISFVTAGDSTQVIALTEATDGTPTNNDNIFVEFGTNNQGKTFYYDSITKVWKDAQQKTKLNQQPLFGMWDDNHVSFNDTTTYPNSSFAGAKAFAFSISDTATTDTVLGIKVKYNTINNVGDILFESDHTAGTFTYKSGVTTITKNLAEGHLHYTTGSETHNSKTAWIKRTNKSKQRVIRTFIVEDAEKQLFVVDFYKNSATLTDLDLSVSVNGNRKNLITDYTLINGTTNTYVKFVKELKVNDQVRIAGHSSATKLNGKGIYELPEGLATNTANQQLGTFTYGQILGHVRDMFDRNQDVTGTIPGSSNLRDKPNARLTGGSIHQHEAPLLPAVFGLIDQQANIISAIDFNNQEYEKWYSSFLTHVTGTAYEGVVADKVDEIIISMTTGRNNTFPFYYEDMIGWGENVSIRSYTVQGQSQTEFALDSQHNITTPSNRAVYVYLNDVQLILGTDYTFSTVDDSVDITATIVLGDKVVIKDYTDTTGSYMPPSPTKLGMYPIFKPESFTDDTYITSQSVIRKHDGSIIKAYNDDRDALILELEKRIYNNCKTAYNSTLLDISDVTPSAFTSADYTLQEINDIMGPDFYTWAGKNNVQYLNNTTFVEGAPFTYNYARSTDRLNAQSLPGHWRGIYKYFYDTDAPHIRPWEMLGHSEKPSTWDATYGTAPYTSGNDILWDAIATYIGRYGKPTIKTHLPVDASGNLLDPLAAQLVDNFDIPGRQASWKFGDQGPAETAWRRSSAYAFSVIKVLALTKPPKFFTNFFDTSRWSTNTAGNQIYTDTGIRLQLSKAKYHLETSTDNATGITTRYHTAGYQPFIVNYIISQNLDPITFYYKKMKNLSVQLAYKLGGFTDKDNLKILTDSVSPGSTSGSKFIPDENYKILFRTSNPVNSFNFSGVLIEKNTDTSSDGSTLLGGYKIVGYSTHKPYFKFNYPVKTTTHSAVSVEGSMQVAQYSSYSELTQTIPYGYVFNTIQDVADFLFGYGHWLEEKGFRFNKYSKELKETLNWSNAVREFLFWTTQEWAPGSAVTVSPAADGFELDTNNSVVGKLKNLAGDYSLLDAGGRKIDISEISTKRTGKTFDLGIKSDSIGLYNIALNTVQKEHILLFDNSTVFADILYDPFTGFRQQRLKLVGWKTGGWNGDYYAPGFMFDAAQVLYWTANTDYKIGDTIEYQGKFYVAKVNHTSVALFNNTNWILKAKKPAPQLIPNFDYKISQFNDFYNLESNNFDESQQKLAQRLIGYQSRDYLENLFVNDVSQYKFYQGYIREKGTQNAIDKILKSQYEGEDISLDLYPEWMIRTGRFGNTDAIENIQITLKDNEITANPQSIELLDNSNDATEYARSVTITKDNFYYKPVEYTASTTFGRLDYTKEGIDREVAQELKTAGYPQLKQVQHTAFNIADIVNLDMNAITANDLIWVANKSNTEWDVFRISFSGVKIVSIKSINDATQLEIIFNGSHKLSAGTTTALADYFGISNSEEETLNGVYSVHSTPDHKTLIIDYEGNTGFIPALEDGSTADSYGNVYKFISVRLASMNNVNTLINYSDYQDKNDSIEREGDKVFADADSSGLWRVYEKQDPYITKLLLSPDTTTVDQDFGWQIVARNDGRSVIVSAPGKSQGEVHFLFRTTPGITLEAQAVSRSIAGDDNTGKLGYSLSMSTDENFVVAGAPYTNTLGSDGSTRFTDSGLIKIFIWNPTTFKYGTLTTRLAPVDAISQNFGWAHKISEPGTNSVRATADKYLFVSAPGHNSDTGRVYMYTWGIGDDGSTYDTWRKDYTLEPPAGGSSQRFGHRLCANDNGDILAVSSLAPGNAGKVEIFVKTSQANDGSTQNSFTLAQTLTGVASDGSTINTAFGDAMTMSKDGTTLIIGAPGLDNTEQPDAGVVYYYKWNADTSSNTYTLQQTINAPDSETNMRFGTSLDTNNNATRLVIGAKNSSTSREMKVDLGETTFDLQDTTFIDLNTGSGAAFTATLYNTEFVIDDKMITDNMSEDDEYGRGVCVIDNSVFVGAPKDSGNVDTADGSSKISKDGTVGCYDLIVNGEYAWKNITTETPLIDINKLGQVFEFDNSTKQIRDYYDLYDPIKGRILGIADREINIKTTWDPATYNNGTNTNTKLAWAENHIGEVWWDLSKVKWLWYEQDTQEYKTNNWGKTFPGSSIDIYEWTETILLPSEYNNPNVQAVNGIPLNETQYTVKQKYNSVLDGFVNYYYYWVKNKTSMPTNSVVQRKNTTAYITNLITNPQRFDFKYYAVTDTDKFLIYNVGNLINDNIILNADIRTTTFDGEAHSVWKLVREGDKFYRPGTQIETRWWDSLIGENSTGDKVPDPDLSVNERYGNNIRPRQSWYVDRYNALKEIIDYANTVLKKNQLVGQINLTNLNSKDAEPTLQSLEWDATVDTYAELSYIDTRNLSGNVNYLIKSDETSNGYWAIYQWNGTNWTRTKLQIYNTSTYWNYTDWYKTTGSMSHDKNVKVDKQVTYEYELEKLDLEIGKHVKVTSADTGGWKLFMKTATSWENVGTENGTVRISTKLYDYTQDATGFAGENTFDDNFFDQEPSIETRKILTALRDDLFINDLAIEYNTLFFTGLRKVLAEQTYVDWMFKTSFINAKNTVRQLDQRKTYTTGTDSWIESYINEVKPFHTKLREYTLGYQGTETQDAINTDFDNPVFYDSSTGKIRSLNVISDTSKLTENPWQMWNDYHKKYVQSITVTKAGSGYETAPTVKVLGGTTSSTGPFQVQATSSSGASSGSYGYYYPLFTSEAQAKIYDSQNSGSGTVNTYTFDGYTGTFYGPTTSISEAQTLISGSFKLYVIPTTTAATATAIIQNGAVTKITVTGIGANYTTTPTVVLLGGKTDGTTPTDTAKAYANLNNDLVRDFDTTIKFDRVKSTSSVVDWVVSTSYIYGQLIRYKNELYKATDTFTATTDFDDNIGKVYKVYGDETGLTASDRTKGFYTPAVGMPGNELSQVMLGVDYGGAMVTGLLFSQEAGWDRAGWYDFAWDNFGASRIKAFTADGSTKTYVFDSAPLLTDVYQVYITHGDSTRTKLADVIRGDGSTVAFTLSITPDENALVEFIPFDEDGVLTPTDDRTLDSIIQGGLFTKGGLYASALGSAPSDIILEGDDFISPDTSYAPEEAVPGQIFDTLDIKVYTSPESGVPFISDLNYKGDGTTTVFAIGNVPGTLGSVTVSVDGSVKKLTTDYTINVANKTITFGTAPVNFSIISTKTFAISGENYRVLDQYTGDGSTVTYTTSTRGEFNLDSTVSDMYITINGVPTTAYTTTTTANTITVTFTSAPAASSLIQVAGFNKSTTSTRSYASIRNEAVQYDGSTVRYTLTYPPGAIGPYSGLTIIEVNGKVLRGPDNTYYLGDGSTYTYGVVTTLGDDSTVDPSKTITLASQVQVFVNGTEKNLNTHYTVDIGNQNIEFVTDAVPTTTDVICISTLVDNHYYNEGTDIILDTAQMSTDGYTLNNSDYISVTTYNNALGMKLRREVLEGRITGVFNLRFDSLNATYTHVWLNGTQLVQGTDFTISSGNIITVAGKIITSADRLDVMYFALGNAVGSTGFRVFKDMLNRIFYKRISKTSTTEIANDVVEGSLEIQVKDGTVLGTPNAANNMPGVIFVDKERIEYFTKSGDTLGQLRRGTLGTGIKEHGSGAEVVDASGTQTIPYADTVYTNTFTGDGSTIAFALSQTPTSASELDIFIGGQRLLLTSEDGSTINYSVDGSTTAVTLSTVPASGTQVKILHKKGQVWYTALDGNPADGKGLQASTTQQAKFIANEPTNAPE